LSAATTRAGTDRAFQAGSRSAQLGGEAPSVLAGGDSRTGLWQAPWPVYVAKAAGNRLWDVDGDVRLDMNPNNTSHIHGHAHPDVVASITAQAASGVSFNLLTPQEVALAQHIVGRIDSVDRVRFANSGTEAVMLAIRAAWARTGRPMIAKFEGPYHGSYPGVDFSLEPTADVYGPAAEPASVPASPGMPAAITANTLVLPFNRPAEVEALVRKHAHELAAIIVEPIPSNLSWINPRPGFLPFLRELTSELGILLIFDEIVNFRLAYGGLQSIAGVVPDLTTLGKFVGGGLPFGVVGGSVDVMQMFDHTTRVDHIQHSGSFNGNPLATGASLVVLEKLTAAEIARINALGDSLRAELLDRIRVGRYHATVTGYGSLMCLFPTTSPVDPASLIDYRTISAARRGDSALLELRRAMLHEGIANGAGQMSLTTVLSDADIEEYLSAVDRAMRSVLTHD
jgi:glutamate-1-semialdehyde 2,1-aminomutase